jgi:hypothetical protein
MQLLGEVVKEVKPLEKASQRTMKRMGRQADGGV